MGNIFLKLWRSTNRRDLLFREIQKRRAKLLRGFSVIRSASDDALTEGGMAKIEISSFAYTATPYLVKSATCAKEEGTGLVSQICRHETLYSPTFRWWMDELKLELRPHRKLWELGYILQALSEAGVIEKGRRGIVFAVGKERTPALLAAMGCEIMATDLADDDLRNEAWSKTSQWAGGLSGLRFPEICNNAIFEQQVRYRAVDMNAIPSDLKDFDFSWSTCSFEHCGSLELGIRFLEEQMKCLKPGGVAVHTTEFNLSSNQDTWTSGGTSVYRLRDIVECIERLTKLGYFVEPLDLRVGTNPLDLHVDRPASSEPYYTQDKHLRLQLGNFACTSIGLIIRKDHKQVASVMGRSQSRPMEQYEPSATQWPARGS